MSAPDPALGEFPALPIDVAQALVGAPTMHRYLVHVDHLRRPVDYLSVVATGEGSAYVVSGANDAETAATLRALADAITRNGVDA